MSWADIDWVLVAALAMLALIVGLAIWDQKRRPPPPSDDNGDGDGPPDKNIW